MTHVVRDVIRAGSRLNKKEAIEPVTIIETPPLVAIGVIGYRETPQGLKPITTAWASFINPNVKRVYLKRWRKEGVKKPFIHHDEKKDEKGLEEKLQKIKEGASVVRVIAHTQMNLVKLVQRKPHIIEIQVNGGSIEEKVDYAKSLFEKSIRVTDVFEEGEMIDACSVGKGKGIEGAIHRFGAKRLQKKTHRGRRKIACIGPWNPKGVSWTIARAGQFGFHHRTEVNKRIYRIGEEEKAGEVNESGSTKFDLTKKSINPMGGFPHYGLVKNQFLMIKGSITGTVKRTITLRKSLFPNKHRIATEEINLKWIDTASKFGNGRFQTKEERIKFLGKLKVNKKAEQQ